MLMNEGSITTKDEIVLAHVFMTFRALESRGLDRDDLKPGAGF